MKKILFLVLGLCMMVFSCSYDVVEKNGEKKVNRNVESGKNGGVDMSVFLDVTLKGVDAQTVTDDVFFELVKGKRYEGGKTSIFFDKTKKMVQVSIDECDMSGYEGCHVDFTYEYAVRSASKNLLYICPKDVQKVKVHVNGKEINALDAGQFSTYFSVYGFGEKRVEVSPHLNEVSFIKGNTYWNR